MRKDMGKVITERPRRRSANKTARKGYGKTLQKLGLDHVQRESISKRGDADKDFTDVLGPLVGFLKKNCGRPWDKVLSEVNAVLPASGGVSYSHARDHLFQMVEQKTQKIDGVLCDTKGMPLDKHTWRRWEFYVDPHGILRAFKQKRLPWRPRQYNFVKTEAGEWCIESEEGIWYAVVMAPYESCGTERYQIGNGKYATTLTKKKYPTVLDVLLGEVSFPNAVETAYGELVYATAKRQLGKREIKKYGLRK